MAKSLSVATILEKNKLSSDKAFLVTLDIDVINPDTGAVVEHARFVRNTEAVTINGANYEPANFDIQLKEESGQLQTVVLSITDYSRAVQQRMQAYGGGVGFGVVICIVSAGNLNAPPEVQEFFEVVGSDSSQYVCNFTLGAENSITKAFPRRRQTRDYCQWRYKDPRCGYTGTLASCDLTLKGANGCEAHGNAPRFGAFRGINIRDTRYG